ncbi:MAG: dihydrofolate reductase [Melioribacteraceae bacterium]
MEKIIIAAISKNNVIGLDGKIPWHSKEELQHFKQTTMSFPVIMGRKTWEAIGKPLIGRLNVVITRDQSFSTQHREIVIFQSLQLAFSYFSTSIYKKVFIIGGGEIFLEAIDKVDSLILSEMNFETEGDTFFPEIDGTKWTLDTNELFTDFTVHHYIRK